VGGAAPSVAEEGQMVAGVVRATAAEEVDFRVLQGDVLVGTKNILQVLTLGADTHQVEELAVVAAVRGTPVEVVEMILVIVVTAVWMVQVTPPVITVITDLPSHNANV